MRNRSTKTRLGAVLLPLALLAAACGDSEGTASANDSGGELVDLGTFVGDSPDHLDPALASTVEVYQVTNALYDGLTDIDARDPDNPKIVPQVAESYEASEDAKVWTFTLRDDVYFSNGEQVVPSSFARAWERASDPDFAGDYSYLFGFIDGGTEKLDGKAETLAGLRADDEAMTLTVTLDEPYSNFDAVVSYQLFFPMPSAVDDLRDQNDWERGLMIGNGPFKMAEPANDQEIVLVRNDEWAGDFRTDRASLDRLVFRVSTDPDSAYNAFEAGEAGMAQIPPARAREAEENHGTTLDTQILGSYHFLFKWDGEILGGPENKLLRQAISQAVNREEINEAVYDGTRAVSTGIVMPGIPGAERNLCDYCTYDPKAAKAAYEAWKDAGNELEQPIPIQFNTGAGNEDVILIMIDNLRAIGIPAVADGLPSETYFPGLAQGGCKAVCRAGWNADYPSYDNFMYDLFHSDSIGGNNFAGFAHEEFDALVDEAKRTLDEERRTELFRKAERILLNEEIAAVPVNWYRGDVVYDDETFENVTQTNFGLVNWELIRRR